jgi:MmgE/PrpD N-terminal domain
VVAGFEVMYLIGRATKHSNERHGFHAPGTTGPFGAAVAAGKLLKLNAVTNALGIAGSLSAGLMKFARSGTGAMVNDCILAGQRKAASSPMAGVSCPAHLVSATYRLCVAPVSIDFDRLWPTLRIGIEGRQPHSDHRPTSSTDATLQWVLAEFPSAAADGRVECASRWGRTSTAANQSLAAQTRGDLGCRIRDSHRNLVRLRRRICQSSRTTLTGLVAKRLAAN